jgi:purine-binding chemotaxis protein CheW
MTTLAHPRIDWEQVRYRVGLSEDSLSSADAPTQDRLQETFRRRAAELGRRKPSQSSATCGTPMLVFHLGNTPYGIELSQVVQIFPIQGWTPVPGAAPHVLGVTNLRGAIHSLLDLRRLWGMRVEADAEAGGCVLLVRAGQMRVGLLAESIEGIRHFQIEELGPVGQLGRDRLGSACQGVAPDGVVVLALEQLFESARDR